MAYNRCTDHSIYGPGGIKLRQGQLFVQVPKEGSGFMRVMVVDGRPMDSWVDRQGSGHPIDGPTITVEELRALKLERGIQYECEAKVGDSTVLLGTFDPTLARAAGRKQLVAKRAAAKRGEPVDLPDKKLLNETVANLPLSLPTAESYSYSKAATAFWLDQNPDVLGKMATGNLPDDVEAAILHYQAPALIRRLKESHELEVADGNDEEADGTFDGSTAATDLLDKLAAKVAGRATRAPLGPVEADCGRIEREFLLKAASALAGVPAQNYSPQPAPDGLVTVAQTVDDELRAMGVAEPEALRYAGVGPQLVASLFKKYQGPGLRDELVRGLANAAEYRPAITYDGERGTLTWMPQEEAEAVKTYLKVLNWTEVGKSPALAWTKAREALNERLRGPF